MVRRVENNSNDNHPVAPAPVAPATANAPMTLDAYIHSMNKVGLPSRYREGQQVGYMATGLRALYVSFAASCILLNFDFSEVVTHPGLNAELRRLLWIAVLVCNETDEIDALRENMDMPQPNVLIRFSPFDLELTDDLRDLAEQAELDLPLWDYDPTQPIAWRRLDELDGYREAYARGMTVQPGLS